MYLREASILGILHRFSDFQMGDRGYRLYTPESICLGIVRKRLDFQVQLHLDSVPIRQSRHRLHVILFCFLSFHCLQHAVQSLANAFSSEWLMNCSSVSRVSLVQALYEFLPLPIQDDIVDCGINAHVHRRSWKDKWETSILLKGPGLTLCPLLQAQLACNWLSLCLQNTW